MRSALVFTSLFLVSVLTACTSSNPPADAGPGDAGGTGPVDAGRPDGGPLAVDAGVMDAGPPGANQWLTTCALCHGDAGEGYRADDAPQLANQDFLAVATDAFLREAIVHGRPGTRMSAFGDVWGGPHDDDAVGDLVTHIRGWQTEPSLDVHEEVVTGDAARGATVYAERCARCHGASGEGDTGVSLNNPRFLATASDGFLRHSIRLGRRGTMMQGWEGELDDATIDDLVVLLRSWATPVVEPPPVIEPPTYEEIVINEGGVEPTFSPLIEGRYVPADEVNAQLELGARMILLDARATSAFHMGHIPGSLSVPFYGTEAVVDFLPRDGTWIIAYCACPHAASGRVMDALRAEGYTNTAVLDEGVVEWETRGYPMESSPGMP